MTSSYDIRYKSESRGIDGTPEITWVVRETRDMDVQSVRSGEGLLEIQVGGERYLPTFRGFIATDANVTATDRVTADSGTTDLLVLRTYEYEGHKELDLKEV